MTEVATITSVGPVKFGEDLNHYLSQGFTVQHYSTAYSPHQGIVYSAILIKE